MSPVGACGGEQERDGKERKMAERRGAGRGKIIQVVYLTFSSFATSHIDRIVKERKDGD